MKSDNRRCDRVSHRPTITIKRFDCQRNAAITTLHVGREDTKGIRTTKPQDEAINPVCCLKIVDATRSFTVSSTITNHFDCRRNAVIEIVRVDPHYPDAPWILKPQDEAISRVVRLKIVDATWASISRRPPIR